MTSPQRSRPKVFAPSLIYLAVFCVWSVLCIAQTPVVVTDTDLWYHLDGGRYLFQHHRIPETSFFSFIDPPRPWVDYAWLFQAIVYAIFSHWQYGGLVALRAGLFCVTLLLIIRLVYRASDGWEVIAWKTAVVVVACLELMSWMTGIRPRLFTYACMAAFLYVLERHPQRAAVLLPPLAVLWCNLHGVAYPVMLLISYAYAAETLLSRLGPRIRLAPRRPGTLLQAALVSAAVLVTPHGTRLLRLPLISTAMASQYISEMAPFNPMDALSFHVYAMAPSSLTVFSLLLLAAGLTLIVAISRGSLRLAHLLLVTGGSVLLAKGVRFGEEWTLLALPLLAATPLLPSAGILRRLPKPVALASIGVVMLMPLRVLVDHSSNPPAFPFSRAGLPHGVAGFLNEAGVGGAVLNAPSSGGYLRWVLSPTYRIFMDMEVPFPFTDDDIYLAIHAFTTASVLRRLVSTYRMPFIVAPLDTGPFPALIKAFPQYTLVFFDDAEALYVDKQQHAALAARHAIDGLDPFAMTAKGVDEFLEQADKPRVLQHVQRLLAIDPGAKTTNHVAARLLNEQANYPQALLRAETLLRNFPESPEGYVCAGDALLGLNQVERALATYQAGLRRSDHTRLSRGIGMAYLRSGQYARAFRALRSGVPLFDPQTSDEDLFQLGSAARLAGDQTTAQAVFQYAQLRLPVDDVDQARRIHAELQRLSEGDH